MEYLVIEDVDTDEFVKKVNDHLRNDWELRGPLAITSYRIDKDGEPVILYAQAMIKEIGIGTTSSGTEAA